MGGVERLRSAMGICSIGDKFKKIRDGDGLVVNGVFFISLLRIASFVAINSLSIIVQMRLLHVESNKF